MGRAAVATRATARPSGAGIEHNAKGDAMCLPLIARVVSADGDFATVALLEGETVRVSRALRPEVGEGQYVLLDRGLIIEEIAPAQVEDMLAFYTELTQMWAEEDATSA